MANGQMLNELREMANAEKITTSSALRLLITSQIEFLEKLTGMEKEQQALRDQLVGSEQAREKEAGAAKDENDDMWELQNGLINRLSNQVQALSDGMSKEIQELSGRVNKLADNPETGIKRLFTNPMIIVGFFVQEHPKWALAIFVALLLLLNMWLIDDIRINILRWLHVPEFFINALNPTPFP
jgi:hypothetical protein